jgi:hypothetical protein
MDSLGRDAADNKGEIMDLFVKITSPEGISKRAYSGIAKETVEATLNGQGHEFVFIEEDEFKGTSTASKPPVEESKTDTPEKIVPVAAKIPKKTQKIEDPYPKPLPKEKAWTKTKKKQFSKSR